MDTESRGNRGAARDRVVARFDAFELRLDTLELRRRGGHLRLPPKASTVLAVLVRNAGSLVDRPTLYRAAWPGTVIEFDQALNTVIRQIRAVLGDDAGAPRFVETVPRRGYRFLPVVELVEVPAPVVRPARPSGVMAAWRMRLGHVVPVLVLAAAAYAAGRNAGGGGGSAPERPGEPPRVEFVADRDDEDFAGIDEALEASVRMHWARGREPAAETAQRLLVTGNVVPAPDGVRLHALIVRVSDGAVLWTGTFNPLCPDTPDPIGSIGYYVAERLRRSARASA